MARGEGAHPDERGVTLVELLVTVGIMGVAVVALASALFVTVAVSDADRRGAAAEADARRYAELVRSAAYIECASADHYFDAVKDDRNVEPSLQREVVSVRYWNGTDTSPMLFTEDCTDGDDPGLQQVTVRSTSADDSGRAVAREVVVIKRGSR